MILEKTFYHDLAKVTSLHLFDEAFPTEGHNWPMASDFELRHTESHGEQIVSKRLFLPGDVVAEFMGILLPVQTLFTLQIIPGLYLHDPYFMGKILHSCAPNMHCDMEKRVFFAKTLIDIGDVLTMDYETTEDYLYRSFHCQCGSPSCRGLINGRLASKQEG